MLEVEVASLEVLPMEVERLEKVLEPMGVVVVMTS